MPRPSGMRTITDHYVRELKKHPWHVGLLLVLVPLAIFLNNFALSFIVASVIDTLSTRGTVPLDQIWDTFGTYIILFIAASILGELVCWRLIVFLIWKLELKVVFSLYMRCFHFLSNQSTQFHADKFGGSLVSQTNKFTSSYVRLADSMVFQVMPFFWTLIFTFAILAPRVPYFALGLAVIALSFIGVNLISYSRIKHLNKEESEANNKLSGHIADMISNISAVKGFAAEDRELKRFDALNKAAVNAMGNVMVNVMKRDVGFGSVLSALMIFMFLFLLIGQATLGITIGTMILMLTYSLNLFSQLWQVNSITRNYNRIYGDALPMSEVLNDEVSVKDIDKPQPSQITRGAISFENVSFAHEESELSENLFSSFDLRINPGEKVGLVGHSGSGKTTLTKLLLRFMDVDSGTIKIDKQDIAQIKQADLRRAIAYVPQEPLLFHRSIRENIAYAKPDATLDEVRDAAAKANATEFIDKLPSSFDTLVGERGVKLSGGQRQRIAIARAILKDAPILVLDEATSALDSESEKLIQDALRELMKGRTAIVIAHRLSTIQKMDRIIVLDNGRIIEQGPHKELLRLKGAYYSLWEHQSGGMIEE